jgi:hypothetical protein
LKTSAGPKRVEPFRRAAIAALMAAGALGARPLAAQQAYVAPPPASGTPSPPSRYPPWVGHFTVLSANAMLGGLTAGIFQRLRGGSFRDGFARGVLGGSIVFIGKELASARFYGAGLAGREVGAVGASVIANASEGRPSLDRFGFPIGPVQLLVRTTGAPRVTARVDLIPLAALAYGLSQKQLRFDAGASLSAGTPVFRAPGLLFRRSWADESRSTGLELAGTVWLSDVPRYGQRYARAVFAHERVHVIQTDALGMTLTEPLEAWLEDRTIAGSWASRHLGLDLGDVLLSGLDLVVHGHDSRPWEMEANFLENR